MNNALKIIVLVLLINSLMFSLLQAQDSANTFRRHEINLGFNNLFQKITYPNSAFIYPINDMLSLSIETTFNFYLYESIYNYENTYTNPSYTPYKTTEREKGTKFDISPLGLISLNIHL